MAQTHKFKVAMSCSGCSGAVERVLKKLDGVTDYEISLEDQTVTVHGDASQAVIFETIKKTGKEVTPL
ncbi:Cytosolic copper metallochaperone [Basidiobolus ranarum]|uniref:Cytosolic copper metallochaperone n=1 Tax=Basidiobolus ranarum TaxID=34480 RepID=A0ABR2X2X9_9FUNG